GLAHELGRDEPVVLRHERVALALTVDDDAERRGLHPARAQAEGELVPEQARERISADAIEDATRALRLVEVRVEVAWVGDALEHALFGDLVEEHPLDLDPRVRLEDDVPEMIRDGLALAVGVGGEQDALDLLGRSPDGLDDLGLPLLLEELVALLESVFDVDAPTFGEVHHVPLAGEHVVFV